MKFKTRKRGTPKQVGKVFPIENAKSLPKIGYTKHPFLIRKSIWSKKVTKAEMDEMLKKFKSELEDNFKRAKYVYRFSSDIQDLNNVLKTGKMGHPTRYEKTSFTVDPTAYLGWIRFTIDKKELLKNNEVEIFPYESTHLPQTVVEQEIRTKKRAIVPLKAIKGVHVYYLDPKSSDIISVDFVKKSAIRAKYMCAIISKKLRHLGIPVYLVRKTTVKEPMAVRKWRELFDFARPPSKYEVVRK